MVGARERTGHGSDGVCVVASERVAGDPQIPQFAFRNPQSPFSGLTRPHPLVGTAHGVADGTADQSAAVPIAQVRTPV